MQMNWKQSLEHWGRGLRNVFFPPLCLACNKHLKHNEKMLCVDCFLHLPLTHFKAKKNNVVERMLWDDQVITERANALLFYEAGSPYSSLFFAFKYNQQPQVAVTLGRMMAQDLEGTGFFDEVDCLLPVPLSKERFCKRGYNQSERLAEGIRQETGIAVDVTSVSRILNNETQTHLGAESRQQNVDHIFSLSQQQQLSGKHVVIVDDVITTGATIRSLAREVLKAGGVRLSVLCLATSGFNRRYQFAHWQRP